MSTVTVTICDKCGATCEYHYHMMMRYYNGGPTDQAELDVCVSCFMDIMGPANKWRKPPVFGPLFERTTLR